MMPHIAPKVLLPEEIDWDNYRLQIQPGSVCVNYLFEFKKDLIVRDGECYCLDAYTSQTYSEHLEWLFKHFHVRSDEFGTRPYL